MQIHIDVWSDFVCPWCYLVSTSLEKLATSHDVTVRWRAYQLRPAGSPPMPEAVKARIKAMRPQFEQMAKMQYGIEINPGKQGIESLPALIGDKFAESQGKGHEFHQAVFEAYWRDAKNIEDTAILADIAETAGLNREAFLAALDDDTLKQDVAADIQQAQMNGLTGVPALVFNDKFLIPGAQPYEELVRVVEQLNKRLTQA
ncbi:MAG: DsbA family oxidoreductase [Aggregatilineales bacterium]